MRQPRKLNTQIDHHEAILSKAFMGLKCTIMLMPEDLKDLLRRYIAAHPTCWWIKINEDYDHELEVLFSGPYYADRHFGVHDLKPEFKEAIEEVLNMG